MGLLRDIFSKIANKIGTEFEKIITTVINKILGMFGLELKNNPDIGWIQVLIYSLLPFGQILMRKQYLKGSIDKIWLFFPIFFVFPFSLLPTILIKYSIVKVAKEGDTTLPIDTIMILPILTKLLLPFIFSYFIEEESKLLDILTLILLPFLTVFIAHLKRRYDKCNKVITKDSVVKALIDSVIVHGVSDIMVQIISIILQTLPSTKRPFLVIKFISGSLFDNIVWVFGFIGVYIIVNIFNQIKLISGHNFCDVPMGGNKIDMIPLKISIIGIILTILSNIFAPPNSLFNLITNIVGGPVVVLLNGLLKSKILKNFLPFLKPKYLTSVIGAENYNTLSSMADPKNLNSLKSVFSMNTLNALKSISDPNTLNALNTIGNPNTINALNTLGSPNTLNALNILSNQEVIAKLGKLTI